MEIKFNLSPRDIFEVNYTLLNKVEFLKSASCTKSWKIKVKPMDAAEVETLLDTEA